MQKIGEELTEVFQLTDEELCIVSGTKDEIDSAMEKLIKELYNAKQVGIVGLRVWPTENQVLVKFRMTKDYL